MGRLGYNKTVGWKLWANGFWSSVCPPVHSQRKITTQPEFKKQQHTGPKESLLIHSPNSVLWLKAVNEFHQQLKTTTAHLTGATNGKRWIGAYVWKLKQSLLLIKAELIKEKHTRFQINSSSVTLLLEPGHPQYSDHEYNATLLKWPHTKNTKKLSQVWSYTGEYI